jgi:cell division protein FtsL
MLTNWLKKSKYFICFLTFLLLCAVCLSNKQHTHNEKLQTNSQSANLLDGSNGIYRICNRHAVAF